MAKGEVKRGLLKTVLLPLMLVLCGCGEYYDSGWLDINSDSEQLRHIFSTRLKDTEEAYIRGLSEANTIVEYLSEDALTEKYGVSYALRKQTNEVLRLRIENGTKIMTLAEFDMHAKRWAFHQVVLPRN